MRRANAQLECDRRVAATHVGCLRAGRNRAFTNPPRNKTSVAQAAKESSR
jgi:hypothetical protein